MISVIVPVYNIQRYILACVESLLAQTYRNIEIILVDDGSADESGKLCDEYAQKDSRIRVIHKPNGGLSSARNAGLDVAHGEWILFVDGDDYLVKDAAERLIRLTDTDVDFIQFYYFETESVDTKPPKSQSVNFEECRDVRKMFEKLYSLGGVAASSCTKLWNRRLFRDIRFKEGILHEDEELMTRLLPICKKVIYTDLVLYGYVMREGSIVHTGFNPRRMDVFPIMEERTKMLQALGYDDLVLQTEARLFNTAALQYCEAKKSGFDNEAAVLKQKLLSLSGYRSLPLSGQYKLLYRLARIFQYAPELYYSIRKLCGKT